MVVVGFGGWCCALLIMYLLTIHFEGRLNACTC